MNNAVFNNSSWIWCEKNYGENEYAEFYDELPYNSGKCLLRISVRGDYTLFVNGKYVSSNQYADFAHYKVYDELDITGFLRPGKNSVAVLVWYFGRSGMRYFTEVPGLIYEIEVGGSVVSGSCPATLSRKSKAYKSGLKKRISRQLGYSFCYDATSEDGWITGELSGFKCSAVISEKSDFYKRPIKKHSVERLCQGSVTKTENSYLIDLGRELVGLFSFSFTSESSQKLCISYGELLENGHTKRLIGDRDFSFEYIAKPGRNEYTSYMLRIACRYIEISCDRPINIDFAGVMPQTYAVREKPFTADNLLDRQIYEISLNTLKLCMMEHYVDCPWREQCLYAFDSRNQMMIGYAAFEDGNLDYARANLLLMSKDSRKDGILSICFPSGEDLTIPSFSLYYVIAVKEYICFSGDLSLADEVFEKITDILRVFAENMKNGLIQRFSGENYWNFYDWTQYADGHCTGETDFLINAIAVIAFDSYDAVCKRLSRINIFNNASQIISDAAQKKFYDSEKELFFISSPSEKPTELANSLAVLSGIASPDAARKICVKLAEGKLLPCSLSMKTFKYDALLRTDKCRYKDVILDEIRTLYKPMTDAGSTTVWEVSEGAAAFDNAGSLCHGWSAVPVYYYQLLNP